MFGCSNSPSARCARPARRRRALRPRSKKRRCRDSRSGSWSLAGVQCSAAVRDILQVTGRRWPAAEILIAPAKMQGLAAAEEIVAARPGPGRPRRRGRSQQIVARGGSLEDLWAFNEEIVARAIAAMNRPLVSAVGHEVDATIADRVAVVSASTARVAGECCVPDAREVAQQLDRLGDRLARASRAAVRPAPAPSPRHPLRSRPGRAPGAALDDRRHRLSRLAAALEALSPLGVLSRGYSLTFRDDDATLIRSPADAPPGSLILTRFASGQILSRVEPID